MKLFTSLVLVLILCCCVPQYAISQAADDTSESSPSNPFLRKGNAFVGLTGGASTRTGENENVLVQNILFREKDAFNLVANGGYLLKNSFAVGGSIRYEWLRSNQLGEDGDGIQTTVDQAGSSITGSLFIKNYIPLTENGRFNLFNITGVGLTVNRTTTESVTQDILTRKYDNGYTFRLGITPGMQVFVMDGFAAELGVNIAGVSTSTTTSTINGVEGTKVHAADLDLTLNILSLNITFFYFIDLQKK